MWVMTTKGFFSAIQFDPRKGTLEDEVRALVGQSSDVLQVRTRAREDAEALAEFVGRPDRVQDTSGDYAHRINVTREEWATFLIEAASGVDYGNFKSAVLDHKHHDAYMRVWSALLSLQDRAPRGGRRGRSSGMSAAQTTLPVDPAEWMWDEDDDAGLWGDEDECDVCSSLVSPETYAENAGLCDACRVCGGWPSSIHDLTAEEFAKMMREEG